MAKALMLLLALFLSLSVSAFSEEHLSHGHGQYPVMAPAPAPKGHHHHHHKAPSPAPTTHHHAPAVSPVQPPTHHHAPTPSPVHPPKKAQAPVQPPSHHHAPTPSPVHPPKKAPVVQPPSQHHAPAPAPVRPPPTRRFKRSFVAVQGVVYCKSCKYAGVDTFQGASPLAGAGVKLVCNNTKFRAALVQAKTDKNGYFYMEAPKTVTSYAAHRCKVVLVSSPLASCNKVSLRQARSAGTLRPQKEFLGPKKLPYVLYSAGPFAFEPTCKHVLAN